MIIDDNVLQPLNTDLIVELQRWPNFPGQDKFKGHMMHSHAVSER